MKLQFIVLALFISLVHVVLSDDEEYEDDQEPPQAPPQLPSCAEIASANPIMCTFIRFKIRCANECRNPGAKNGAATPQTTKAGSPMNTTPTKAGSPAPTKVQIMNNKPGNNPQQQVQTTTKPSVGPVSTTKLAGNKNSNKNCNKIDPCVDEATANAGFRKRCEAGGVAATCLDKCRYNITFDEMKQALQSKQCPVGDGQMRNLVIAASNGQDNNNCCQQTGVLDGKRAICTPFCNPNGEEWPTPRQAYFKYMPCSSALNAVMRCHWAGLTN